MLDTMIVKHSEYSESPVHVDGSIPAEIPVITDPNQDSGSDYKSLDTSSESEAASPP
jgi:hypothetical protein